MVVLALQSQFRRDYVLGSASDHQRLRDVAERRKGEALLAPRDSASCEVDLDVLAGDDCFFFLGDLVGELFAQSPEQRWDLDAQEAVVIGITQVGLRETSCNDQRNTFRLQAGHGLFATGSRGEIEAADDYVAGLR